MKLSTFTCATTPVLKRNSRKPGVWQAPGPMTTDSDAALLATSIARELNTAGRPTGTADVGDLAV